MRILHFWLERLTMDKWGIMFIVAVLMLLGCITFSIYLAISISIDAKEIYKEVDKLAKEIAELKVDIEKQQYYYVKGKK